MPVVNVASQGEFIIDKTFIILDKLFALYTNGFVQDITSFQAIYDNESIVLPEPEVLVDSASFTYGTDTDLAAVIQLAKSGVIDLHDYWTVGESRTVSLSAMSASGVGESHAAQNVEYVIMHDFNKNGDLGGILPEAGSLGFLLGQKDCLKTGGYMNSSNTNAGSWNSSARRTWCNNVYLNALPSWLKDNAVRMSIKTAASYNGSTLQTTTDKVALFAAKEIFGGETQTSAGTNTSYSNLAEFNALTQVEYYKTAANRIKTMNNSASDWWERSPHYGSATIFCRVNADGSAGNYNASLTRGLAPFICI